jgi:hypothetical protein
MGFRSTVAPTSGKRQVVEAVGVDRAVRAKLGDVGGNLLWSSSDRMSGLLTFPSCSLTDTMASRDGERSNSRVT